MSEVKNASEVAFNLQAELLAAQSELAALREELAKAESDNDTIAEHNIELQQRLTAAEQRNAIMAECLERLRGCSQLRPTPSLIELIDSALEVRDAKD